MTSTAPWPRLTNLYRPDAIPERAGLRSAPPNDPRADEEVAMVPRRASVLRSLGLVALVACCRCGAVAQAADAVTVTTPYPAVVADPGRLGPLPDRHRRQGGRHRRPRGDRGADGLDGQLPRWRLAGLGRLRRRLQAGHGRPRGQGPRRRPPGVPHLAVRATERGGGSATLPPRSGSPTPPRRRDPGGAATRRSRVPRARPIASTSR